MRAASILRRLNADSLVVTMFGDDYPLHYYGIPTVRLQRTCNVGGFADIVRSFNPKVLVTDTRPYGPRDTLIEVMWERRLDGLKNVHVHALRSRPERLDSGVWDLVIAVEGEVPEVDCRTVDASPSLIIDPKDAYSRDESRAILGCSQEKVVLVVDTRWQPGLMYRLASRWSPAPVTALDPYKHFPAMKYLRAADVVVGGAGGRLTDECRALGVPLVAVCMPGAEDQKLRHPNLDADAIRKSIHAQLLAGPQTPLGTNRVGLAVSALRDTLERK